MRKQEFLAQLRKGLSGLPQEDIEERLTFYSETIEDRIEDGLSEEEAVSAVGPVEKIIAQVVADIPCAKIAKERKIEKRKRNPLVIVLLVLGCPIWLSLGIAAVSVIFSLYISLWSVIISLWAVFLSVAACSIGGILAAITFACSGNGLTGIAMIGAGIACAGLTIFLLYGCKAATNGTLLLSKKLVLGVKKCFINKEEA